MSKQIKDFFINAHKEVRTIWLWITAALIYSASIVGIYYAYWTIYQTMMNIWGVTVENVARAPEWVQFLYQWSNTIVQVLQNGLLFGGTLFLSRMAKIQKHSVHQVQAFGKCVILGILCVIGMWGLLLMLGSVRIGWSINRPSAAINQWILMAVMFVAALSEGIFFYHGLYGICRKSIPLWATAMVMIVLQTIIALFQGTFQPLRLVNGALMIGVCTLLTHCYGAGAVIGFRFAWNWVERVVCAFGGAMITRYETYPVNMYWLNGGNGGLMNGTLVTIVLLGLCAWLIQTTMRTSTINSTNYKWSAWLVHRLPVYRGTRK